MLFDINSPYFDRLYTFILVIEIISNFRAMIGSFVGRIVVSFRNNNQGLISVWIFYMKLQIKVMSSCTLSL